MTLNNFFNKQIKDFEKFSKKNWFFWTLAIFFCLYSFLGSLNQGRFNYDGYHWGLVASNAKDFLEGKLPYKDFFVHYGIITLIFQTLALKIYSSIYSLIFLSAVLYALSVINVLLILKKISNIKFCYFIS